MHMADALVGPAAAAAMYALSGAAAGYSIKKVPLENEPRKIPVMGVMGAFVFAAQMINFTIPGTGSSGHLCGGMLLAALLGPWAGFLTMTGILLIQCLLFADGGLLALGCNIWNMAFYSCFIGAMLIWKPIMRTGVTKRRIISASILGCVAALQMGAFSVVLETSASGITELPFITFLSFMQPIHLAVGLLEGLITAAVLCFIYEARPELLWCTQEPGEKRVGKISFRNTLLLLFLVVVLIAGVLSLAASQYPDGLEWSVEKAAGSGEIGASGGIYEHMANIQEVTSILPEYGFKGSDTPAGTSLSGIVGALTVMGLCISGAYLFRFFRKKASNE